MRKKNKLVDKSKFGDIPIIIRKDVPNGMMYLISGDLPLEEFDDIIKMPDGVPTPTMISRFKKRLNPRRLGKILDIKD